MAAVDRDDLRRVLGELDNPKVIDILALGPSLNDLEVAVVVAAGDHDVLAKRRHDVPATAVRVAEILSTGEDDEEVLSKPGPESISDT